MQNKPNGLQSQTDKQKHNKLRIKYQIISRMQEQFKQTLCYGFSF